MTKLIVCIIALYLVFRLLFSRQDKQRIQSFFKSRTKDGDIIEGEIVDDDNNESNKGDKR